MKLRTISSASHDAAPVRWMYPSLISLRRVAASAARATSLGRVMSTALGLIAVQQISVAQVVINESGWSLRACVTGVPEIRAVAHEASTGSIYSASDAAGLAGVYRVDPNCALTQVVSVAHANGVIVDPLSGALYFDDVWGGDIYRVWAGTNTFSTWVSGFHSGDDDPFGMAIAPSDYTGPVVAPGEALVIDPGYNGGPKQIWRWSPVSPQGEIQVHAGNNLLAEPTDVAIGHDAIYFVDWAAGTFPGRLWRLNAPYTAVPIATQGFLPPVGGIAIDPLDQSLLLRSSDQVLRVDPSNGSTSLVATLPAGATGAPVGIDISADGRTLIVPDKTTATLYIFDRALITSSDPALALPLAAVTVDAEIATLNGPPPIFNPSLWQPLWRHTDLHASSAFGCGQSGVNAQAQPFVSTATWLNGVDEVTYDNCSSAWYRFTFTMPPSFKAPRLAGIANVDDQGVVFLNGHQVSGSMHQAGCQPTSPTDPCYAQFDTEHDGTDATGLSILTAPTLDRFTVSNAAWFHPGQNELVFAVCGNASPNEPTGLEFAASLHWNEAASSYCTAKIDSSGCVPSISAIGQPSLSLLTPFEVRAGSIQSQRTGILLYGFAANSVPWKGGWLCVQAPIHRTSLQNSGGIGGVCTGSLSVDFAALARSGINPQLNAGSTVFAQAWYRDPLGSAGSGLSAGLSFTLEP